MKSAIDSLLVLALVCVSVSSSVAQTPSAGNILPGKEVAGLKLGSDFSTFQKVFPKQPNIDQDTRGSFADGCPDRSYRWPDLERGGTGVVAYFKGDAIIQLSIETPRFSLPDGIRINSTQQQVEHAFPRGKQYVLQGSGSDINGGKNLHYLVDRSAGVAIELFWDSKRQQRLVGAIDIFPVDSVFRPEGCIYEPRKWVALKSDPLTATQKPHAAHKAPPTPQSPPD